MKGKDEIRKFCFPPSDSITTINTFEIRIEDISGYRNYATLTGRNELGWTMENKSKNELKRYIGKSYFITVYVKRGKDLENFQTILERENRRDQTRNRVKKF